VSIRKLDWHREYWIVRPQEETITVMLLQNGDYAFRTYEPESKHIRVSVLDCDIDLSLVFPQAAGSAADETR
jgi:Uma2 family endonuclease